MLTRLEAGTIFARDYRVVGLLSDKGGFGAVYRVGQISNGKERALKILRVQFAEDPKMRARFEQEARIGSKIESEHVVEVSASGIDEATGTPWLAMELLDGEDLSRVLEARGRLGAAEVLSILEDACDAIGAAHREGILHLDLKPENLFVAKKKLRGVTSVVKVLDFGIARIVADNRMSATVTSVIGSWLWAAPEQAGARKGDKVSPASDVWSLGLIAFHLLTGGYYWDEANVAPGEEPRAAAVLTEVLTSALPPPSERAAELGVTLPAGFDGWFARCVARSGRYANATEAIEGLRPVLDAVAAPMSAPPGVRHSPTEPLSEPPRVPVVGPRGARTEVMPPSEQVPGGGWTPPSPRPAPVVAPRRRLQTPAVVIGVLVAGSALGLVGSKVMGKSSPVVMEAVDAGRPVAAVVVHDAGPPCPRGMSFVPAGKFMMGSDGDAGPATGHRVRLTAYCMDQNEVTVAEYRACASRGECPAAATTVEWSNVSSADHRTWDRFCNGGRSDRDTHPVNCVDWTSANSYCHANHKELPTEAQWEYAARGTDGRIYPWGNQPLDETRLNACGSECVTMGHRDLHQTWTPMYRGNDGWESTAPVGSYAAGQSPFGLFDMAGNVWEWTADWHAEYNIGQGSVVLNPTGATTGTSRVFRGGSWNIFVPSAVRASLRYANAVTYRDIGVGFRCARGAIHLNPQ